MTIVESDGVIWIYPGGSHPLYCNVVRQSPVSSLILGPRAESRVRKCVFVFVQNPKTHLLNLIFHNSDELIRFKAAHCIQYTHNN